MYFHYLVSLLMGLHVIKLAKFLESLGKMHSCCRKIMIESIHVKIRLFCKLQIRIMGMKVCTLPKRFVLNGIIASFLSCFLMVYRESLVRRKEMLQKDIGNDHLLPPEEEKR